MKTFLDAGVLLTAWRGRDAEAALAVMEDPRRQFYTSQLVKLELLPKPAFFKQAAETEFYQTHFRAARGEEPLSVELGEKAEQLARQHGLAAMDALHLAAAIRQGAHEFITAEKPGKPMFRVRAITVKSIHTQPV
ncbi:MAG: PIN domain-containing protein [Verrucomicrobiota bacterium]